MFKTKRHLFLNIRDTLYGDKFMPKKMVAYFPLEFKGMEDRCWPRLAMVCGQHKKQQQQKRDMRQFLHSITGGSSSCCCNSSSSRKKSENWTYFRSTQRIDYYKKKIWNPPTPYYFNLETLYLFSETHLYFMRRTRPKATTQTSY